jgi:hypothetical protein
MKYQLALLCVFVALSGCKSPFKHNLPPAEQIMHPGPGVDGPGPGVMMLGDPGPMPMPGAASQIAFVGPDGMEVVWDVSQPGAFDSEPLICPARYNFPQGAIYRIKLMNIPGRAGVELYPTLEVGPSLPRTDAYLAHNAIPIQWTEEDFDQVLSGNFVTKVIYLPDADYQELALAGVETLVSTRLDPGVDPIVEADRRGAILAIARLGNKDLEVPSVDPAVGGVQAAAYQTDANGNPICENPGMMPGGVVGGGGPVPLGISPPGPPVGVPPQFMAGVSAPEFGMPYTGTPIGLPGPPHIPLGSPAGLQRHTIRNHTHRHIPKPTHNVKIHVKQSPGMSYPKPASHAYVHEKARAPLFQNGIGSLFHRRPSAGAASAAVADEDCEQ